MHCPIILVTQEGLRYLETSPPHSGHYVLLVDREGADLSTLLNHPFFAKVGGGPVLHIWFVLNTKLKEKNVDEMLWSGF